jgi:type I restriction enzyme M protein
VLTPGWYVGIIDAIDDGIPFEVKMGELTKRLGEQMAREKELDEEIRRQLKKIGFEIEQAFQIEVSIPSNFERLRKVKYRIDYFTLNQ